MYWRRIAGDKIAGATHLFARAGRRIIPTEHAFRLAEHAREVMRRVREIQQDFSNVADDDSRPFHFATGATTLIHRLGGPLPAELAEAPFLLYPKTSNMRSMIDRFFVELGITPRVIMEADDTEAIKRLVEAGFCYSILPQLALRGRGARFQMLRVAGHRLIRQQALAMAQTEYPRALTTAIAGFLQRTLAAAG